MRDQCFHQIENQNRCISGDCLETAEDKPSPEKSTVKKVADDSVGEDKGTTVEFAVSSDSASEVTELEEEDAEEEVLDSLEVDIFSDVHGPSPDEDA